MPSTTEPTLVPGFKHLPGNHCGSTALRNLLGFAGVELSEEMAFGLGAGACFYYLPSPTPRRPAGSTGGPLASRRAFAS